MILPCLRIFHLRASWLTIFGLVVAGGLLWCNPASVRSQEPRSAETAPAEERPTSVTPVQLVDALRPDPEKAHRQQAVVIGSTLLALITVTGLCLIAFVFVMGRRTRMLARKALPGCAPADPLWYLKPRPPVPPSGERLTGEPRD